MKATDVHRGVKRICVLTSAHMVRDTRIYHKECRSLHEAGYHVTLIARDSENVRVNDIEVVALSAGGGPVDKAPEHVPECFCSRCGLTPICTTCTIPICSGLVLCCGCCAAGR